MQTNSTDYYARRATREQALADAAISPAIAAIHRELARRYRDHIEQGATSLPA